MSNSSGSVSGRLGRVLSIQSHTVQGYVGNKAAVFPLQLLDFDVDFINSVHLSNHTGYSTWKGDILTGEQLWALVEGLEANGLLFYTHLLTGYVGSLSFLETVVKVVHKLRSINPGLIYVCDPVMGDDGKLYVRPELVSVYLEQVMPLANVLTPNQFEAEQLTGIRILTEDDAHKVCNALHGAGPEKIVITSANISGRLLVVGSSREGMEKPRRFQIKIPKLPVYVTGTGDLMAALLLAWLHRCSGNLLKAAELSVATVQAVLRQTIGGDQQVGRESASDGHLEMCLVQSREHILSPVVTFLAEPFLLD